VATEAISKALEVGVIDENGALLSGLKVTPKKINVDQQISLLGGFKNVAVKVVTKGQVASGYRLTNIQFHRRTSHCFPIIPN